MKVPNESGLSPNNGLENAILSDPREGEAKRPGAKTTSPDGKAGYVMTHVCHRVSKKNGKGDPISAHAGNMQFGNWHSALAD